MARSFDLPKPDCKGVDVLVIAGEHSGDEHAARLIEKALSRRPGLKVCALGGRRLEAAGAQLLFDLTEYSIVGFVEVLSHYSELKKLFEEIVLWIIEHRPRAVVFVDYPGMNLRIAKRLFEEDIAARAGGATRLLYYIGPQVWAWKAKRKYEMARILDSLAVIFSFEVDVFADTELETRFVGHPFMDEAYELPVHYDADGPVLLLPGSRRAAVARIAPALFAAFDRCLRQRTKLRAVCIYPTEELRQLLAGILKRYPTLEGKLALVPNQGSVGASSVLASSGTMSLSCALANIPGAIAYRTHPLTYLLGRLWVKIPFIGISNLLLDKAMYPEYIQGRATPGALAKELSDCIENPERIKRTRGCGVELRGLLDSPAEGDAADWLLESLR